MTKVEEIVKIISERIKSGTYTSRQRLPSEYQLAQEFNVSRLTIRKAIGRLINAKVLVKDPGKGTYVMLGAEKIQKLNLVVEDYKVLRKLLENMERQRILKY